MTEKIRELKGVGEKTEKLLAKLGILTVEQLLLYYPRAYEEYDKCREIKELDIDKTAAILGTVTGSAQTAQARGKVIVTACAADASGRISLIWYNMAFLRNTLKRGSVFVFRGKVTEKKGRRQMEQPEIFLPAAYEQVLHSLQPVYALTAGVTSKGLAKLVRQALDRQEVFPEYLPEETREKYHLADYSYALQAIHFPRNMDELLTARRRLVFDEFLLFILGIQMMKGRTEKEINHFPMKKTWTTEQVLENLPYTLTNAQKRVWYDIESDLGGNALMSRLIQGDVGSGKTILAFFAMIMAAENGYQAALMVPTEVLAEQHFKALVSLLEQQKLFGCHPVLLTGSSTAKEKREIYQKIASGETNLIVGTHALIQERVQYKALALVITDEQHRFGVKQREALSKKGELPNVLVMSATPIPRTLAVILYGDLDISVLDELPARRLPIKNCVVDTSYRPKAYRFMERQIREGRQVYVICPMVEESEGMDGENVLDYAKSLSEIFPEEIRVAALHGKMKPKQKNQIMEAFAANEIQILVSTTVVEVGVDVPNATVMMIENAERFGLAQLHQLRGRVGRGSYQSYCIFMQGSGEKEISRRLEILNKSNDGFYIAGEDLKLRGPGDLFGIRQSGVLEFRIGDIYNDAKILHEASEAAGEILALDAELSLAQNALLREKVSLHTQGGFENL
ncbi:MAG: ATP-dependent DNA helicase RecG [Eubacteriales bacterium]|nr:ATP-dependent DNA helicase RecG [Eubacteriales bacterium]